MSSSPSSPESSSSSSDSEPMSEEESSPSPPPPVRPNVYRENAYAFRNEAIAQGRIPRYLVAKVIIDKMHTMPTFLAKIEDPVLLANFKGAFACVQLEANLVRYPGKNEEWVSCRNRPYDVPICTLNKLAGVNTSIFFKWDRPLRDIDPAKVKTVSEGLSPQGVWEERGVMPIDAFIYSEYE